ncbi:methyltransferase [Rhodococcus tibetensis]|uniref:Methyltransferase n=1 Tax=Rhodococcus tibetensis TaxID=2965064 RepID=A0ABT1QJA9_9NOCA|nr:methyltransferase [Rhodococcus sp. FXJ9.536]MCQ4122376.1 methyltransferase [Rhodococcus sp. FXJ9.536]
MGTDFIFTDRADYVGEDRVLYLSDNESLLRAQTLPDCREGRVLDVGTGSGVQTVAAFRRGATSVVSVDINPRATDMARFNLALNGLPTDGVVLTDFAELESDAPFDLMVSNPPFVPVPPDTQFMRSGASGQDGLDFIRLLLERRTALLAKGGTFCLVSISVGPFAFSELERLLVADYHQESVRIDVQTIFPAPAPIEDFIDVFGDLSTANDWRKSLRAAGFTHLHNLLVTVSKAPLSEFRRTALARTLPPVGENKGSVDWPDYLDEVRLARASAQQTCSLSPGLDRASNTGNCPQP